MTETRKCPRKGFTLLELMVVVGIIGILSAVLLKTVGGTGESARAAKCLAHMHNLASACQSVGMADGYWPSAGSREYRTRIRKTGSSGGNRERYHDSPGWISWYSKSAYPDHLDSNGNYTRYATAHQAGSSWMISCYQSDREKAHYCLTNGAIWKAVNGSASAYLCPTHQVCAKKWGLEPHWSYVMNSYFGYDPNNGSKAHIGSGRLTFSSVKRTERRLLFAELVFNDENEGQTVRHTVATGTEFDPTLQYAKENPTSAEKAYAEIIGFNHKAKRNWYAHVCFADGHTERLVMPDASGRSQQKLKELTRWLCEGEDITYADSKYERLTQ